MFDVGASNSPIGSGETPDIDRTYRDKVISDISNTESGDDKLVHEDDEVKPTSGKAYCEF